MYQLRFDDEATEGIARLKKEAIPSRVSYDKRKGKEGRYIKGYPTLGRIALDVERGKCLQMLVCQIEVPSTSARHFGAVLLLLFACLCLEDTKVVVVAGLHLHPEAIRDTQSLL